MTALSKELRAALDDPARYEWGEGPWEHLGDAERDVRRLLDEIDTAERELARLREEIRLREESQIPVIPRGAQRKIEGLEAKLARLQEGLRRIRENAGSWHGSEGLDTGHARALAVIAEWCDALLADTPNHAAPDPR